LRKSFKDVTQIEKNVVNDVSQKREVYNRA